MDATTAASLLDLVEDAQRRRRRQDPQADQMVEERYPEVLAALHWFGAQGSPDDAFRLATGLVLFWMATKRIDEGDAWFAGALADPRATARAYYDHGYLVFWAGKYDLAEQRFRESLERAEQDGDRSLQALALAGLGRVVINTDVPEAVRLLRQAQSATDGLDDTDPGRSSALHVLGVALQMNGELAAAREVMSARLETGRSTGDEIVVWGELGNLSTVERRLGNLDRAEELALEALAVCARRSDEMSIGWMLNGLAAIAAARGRFDRAATLQGLADAQLARAGGGWPPDERAIREETLATLHAHLPEESLTQIRTQAAAISVSEALTYAQSSVA